MEARAPTVDLLTWVFGNPDVKEDDLIYIDAAESPQSHTRTQTQTPSHLQPEPEPEHHHHQIQTQAKSSGSIGGGGIGGEGGAAALRKGQLRTLVRQLVTGFTHLISAASSASSAASAAAVSASSSCSASDRRKLPPLASHPSSSHNNSISYFSLPSTTGDTANSILAHSLVARPPLPALHPRHASSLVVCVHSFNDIIYPALFLGVVGAGGQWTGSNPAYTVGELTHHLKTSKSTHIITCSEGLDTTLAAARECGIPIDHVYLLTSTQPHPHTPPGVRCWTELLQHGQSDWITFDDESRAKDTTIALFSTSGTTGLPKMAERSHHSFVAESFALKDTRPKQYKASRLISVPMFHAFASALGLVSALRDGCPTYVMRRFSRPMFLDILHHHQITETAVVPPLLLSFLQYTPEEQAKLGSLHSVWCGGSPLDTVTQGKALQLFAPNARIVQVWGMTETGWITTFRYPECDNTGSVGRVVPGYQARCIDEQGNDVSSDDVSGEIIVKGPMLMRGYLGDIQATRNTIDENGWLHTGDIGFIRQGKVYIVDRKKELIKVRGWQIAPAELEGILLMHPEIVDAAVIGISKPGASTEIPRAYVVVLPGSNLQKTDIKVFLLQHLARYKVSDCEIYFRTNIPKSISGKILRKILRAEFADELARAAKACTEPDSKAWVQQPYLTTAAAAAAAASSSAAPDVFLVYMLQALWRWLGAARFCRYVADMLVSKPTRAIAS